MAGLLVGLWHRLNSPKFERVANSPVSILFMGTLMLVLDLVSYLSKLLTVCSRLELKRDSCALLKSISFYFWDRMLSFINCSPFCQRPL
jgi:hypothetical protein